MRLFLAMLIITTIEVILIAKVGNMIGFFNTFLLIIITAMIGSWQLRKQWAFVMGKLQSLQSQPSQALLEALILLVCGVLLITPGFLTDIVGFLGLVPTLRERFVGVMQNNFGKIMRGSVHTYTHQSSSTDGASPFEQRSQRGGRHDDSIIEGEFERTETSDEHSHHVSKKPGND